MVCQVDKSGIKNIAYEADPMIMPNHRKMTET